MYSTIVASVITAFVTAFLTFLIQERRLRSEMRTEFMAEQAVRDLLEVEIWPKRSFEAIKSRVGGFEDDELRKILVRAGAVRFKGKENKELWGLVSRNKKKIQEPPVHLQCGLLKASDELSDE